MSSIRHQTFAGCRPGGPRPGARRLLAIINQPQDGIVTGDEQRGSVAIVNWELATRLAKSFDVLLYAPLHKGQRRCERYKGVEIRRIPFGSIKVHKAIQLLAGQIRTPHPYFSSMFYCRGYFNGVAEALQRDAPDIVHLPEQVQFGPLLQSALPSARLVLHMHQDALALLPAHSMHGGLSSFDRIVTVSEWIARRVRARFPALEARIHSIGNGVDVKRFHPSDAPRASRESVRLIFVGRISPEKGVHLLMQAFDRLVRDGADVTLDLVGKPGLLPFDVLGLLLRDDPQLQALVPFYGEKLLGRLWATRRYQRAGYLRYAVSRLSATARTRLKVHGMIGHNELGNLYRDSDVLVLPSVWNESYGLPVAEAMASGVPVLASECGGLPELLEPGVSGVLVRRGDSTALYEALCDLVADRGKLADMGRRARQRAQLLSWDRSVERLRSIYDRVLVRSGQLASLQFGLLSAGMLGT